MHLLEIAQNKRGATAVEFALVLPVLLLILCGVVAYGTYIGASHSIAQLAADAARASVAGLNDAERARIAQAHVENSAKDYLLISPQRISITAQASQSDPEIFQVALTYNTEDLPIWGLGALVPLPSKQIVRAASIRRGGA